MIAFALTVRIGWAAWAAHAQPEAVVSADSFDYVDSARALVGAVAAGAAVFARPPEGVQLRHAAALGVMIAVATIIRPTTYYFPVLVLVLFAVRFWHVPLLAPLAALGIRHIVQELGERSGGPARPPRSITEIGR